MARAASLPLLHLSLDIVTAHLAVLGVQQRSFCLETCNLLSFAALWQFGLFGPTEERLQLLLLSQASSPSSFTTCRRSTRLRHSAHFEV